ncbi:CLUMA_CG004712, isoform A [Clunio marinus]|uniref:CLUMA_CG004712, isoform A n=1 Tax=Clunio marinus TaxID=568069 RepID=A0A1J1HSH0_9DIPT|nr:CLUMA_CG004712, isoform A [Clunio marinus]
MSLQMEKNFVSSHDCCFPQITILLRQFLNLFPSTLRNKLFLAMWICIECFIRIEFLSSKMHLQDKKKEKLQSTLHILFQSRCILDKALKCIQVEKAITEVPSWFMYLINLKLI